MGWGSVGVIILEKIVLWLRLWSYQMIILCCVCSCGLFLEKIGLLLGLCGLIVEKLSICCCWGCGCGHSSQLDCFVVVVVVV